MQQVEEVVHDAQAAIQAYRQARRAYAEAVRLEMQMVDERSTVKHDAIARIMQGTNSLTGKQHSCSSAEAIVEADETYASFLVNMRNLVHSKLRAQTDYVCAQMQVTLATTLCALTEVE